VSSTKRPDQRVAVVIPAKDEAERIATTVRACRSIPRVDLVIVVDDGSTDGTQDHARAAGAVTVRHSVSRGKASAMETGASVVAMRDYSDGPARLLLFIDADLGDSAASCAELVPPVVGRVADMATAGPAAPRRRPGTSVKSAVRGLGVLPPLRVCAKGSRFLPERRITPTPPRPGAVAMAAMVGWNADMAGSYREFDGRYYIVISQ